MYLFLYVWAVNTKEVPTTIKEWKLTVVTDRQKIEGERVEDISKWHQHSKRNAVQHGFQVVQDIREPVSPFPQLPLQHGISSEGWVCFLIRKTKESSIKNATITLTATDSFGREYSVRSHTPWTCKGDMVNPQIPCDRRDPRQRACSLTAARAKGTMLPISRSEAAVQSSVTERPGILRKWRRLAVATL